MPFLQDAFSDISHVTALGLERATDRQIWEYAKANVFVVVTSDGDFGELSVILGAPSHIVRLKGENLSKSETLRLLLGNCHYVQQRVTDGQACIEIVKRAYQS